MFNHFHFNCYKSSNPCGKKIKKKFIDVFKIPKQRSYSWKLRDIYFLNRFCSLYLQCNFWRVSGEHSCGLLGVKMRNPIYIVQSTTVHPL